MGGALINGPCVKNLKQSFWGKNPQEIRLKKSAFHEKQSHGNNLFRSLSNSQKLQVAFLELLEF